MGHRRRCKDPDVWQHVMVRGIARRSICDHERDARSFFDRAEHSVERGDLRIACCCLMPNHGHLIVRSPTGRLGDAMRNIEGMYVRGFNRPRGRRGHLLQARYRAKPIRSHRYMTAAIAYTDQNPVEAGLVSIPSEYPHGSARHYARTVGPAWLDRSWVESYLRAYSGKARYSPSAYARIFGTRTSASARRWFESAMESPLLDPPALEVLVAASPDYILQWMDEQARSADGTGRVLPLADAQTVEGVVSQLPASDRTRPMGRGKRQRPLERLLRAGLLRRLAGVPLLEIGQRLGLSQSGARLAAADHDRFLTADDGYRELVGRVSKAVLDACHPPILAEK